MKKRKRRRCYIKGTGDRKFGKKGDSGRIIAEKRHGRRGRERRDEEKKYKNKSERDGRRKQSDQDGVTSLVTFVPCTNDTIYELYRTA